MRHMVLAICFMLFAACFAAPVVKTKQEGETGHDIEKRQYDLYGSYGYGSYDYYGLYGYGYPFLDYYYYDPFFYDYYYGYGLPFFGLYDYYGYGFPFFGGYGYGGFGGFGFYG